MLNFYKMVFNQAGEGGAGGGAGAGSGGGQGSGGDGGGAGGGSAGGAGAGDGGDPLFDGSGGKEGGQGKGGDGGGGDKGGAKGGTGNNSGNAGGNPAPVVIPQNWKDALPDDLKADPSLNIIQDVPALVKSYVNAQKMIGRDKVAIPSKDGTEADWKEVFHKLGVPRDSKEYQVELDKDVKLDGEFFDQFKAKAHEFGLLPKQAAKLANWFGKLNGEVVAEAGKKNEEFSKAEMAKLKTEWGQAWDANIVRAKSALAEYADKDMMKFFKESGLGRTPMFIKFAAKVGELLSEDAIKRHGFGEAGPVGMSPEAALSKIAEIKGNPQHPYWNDKHENHQKAKQEFQQLFEQAYPKKK